jgi:hypothetical protein
MSSLSTLPENPYFSVTNDMLTVHCHKKTIRLNVADIKKMYLKKNSNYWHQIVGHLLAAPSNVYDLHIQTQDSGVCITINPLERYYFIKLIAHLRLERKTGGTKQPVKRPYYVGVA